LPTWRPLRAGAGRDWRFGARDAIGIELEIVASRSPKLARLPACNGPSDVALLRQPLANGIMKSSPAVAHRQSPGSRRCKAPGSSIGVLSRSSGRDAAACGTSCVKVKASGIDPSSHWPGRPPAGRAWLDLVGCHRVCDIGRVILIRRRQNLDAGRHQVARFIAPSHLPPWLRLAARGQRHRRDCDNNLLVIARLKDPDQDTCAHASIAAKKTHTGRHACLEDRVRRTDLRMPGRVHIIVIGCSPPACSRSMTQPYVNAYWACASPGACLSQSPFTSPARCRNHANPAVTLARRFTGTFPGKVLPYSAAQVAAGLSAPAWSICCMARDRSLQHACIT